jgi:hypothetical protein
MRSLNKKTIFVALVFCLLLSVLLFLITLSSIYLSVAKTCKEGKQQYEGDCVQAMIHRLNSPNFTAREKNKAIWVLGQLADKRALPELTKRFSGIPEHKEPLGEKISQYELYKAIKWCENGNSTSFMYKYVK